MKISKIIFTISALSILVLFSCGETASKDKTEAKQEKNEIIEQEEFNLNGDSNKEEVESTETDEQSNVATIVVKANKAVEYKFKINQYEKLTYEWKSTAPLHYDFHGDPEAKQSYPQGYFESYAIGTSDLVKGKATIPYKGAHGWYWKNESGKDVTITLTTKGKYDIVGLIQ